MTRPTRIVAMAVLLAVAFAASAARADVTWQVEGGTWRFQNTALRLACDRDMYCAVEYDDGAAVRSITDVARSNALSRPSHYVVLDDGPVTDFPIDDWSVEDVTTEFGAGKRMTLGGTDAQGRIRKTLAIDLFPDEPNAVVTQATWTNLGAAPLAVQRMVSSQFRLDRSLVDPAADRFAFKLLQGRAGAWGEDYVKDVTVDYDRQNCVGMPEAGQGGGGIPVDDLWGPEMGMLVGHVSKTPEFVDLPVRTGADGRVAVSVEERFSPAYGPISIAPGASVSSVKTLVVVHHGDFFDGLRTYARLLNAEGVRTFKETPATVPGSYWKTWGYGTNFRAADVLAATTELKALGLGMVLLDDGWFEKYGDWTPSADKFPGGELEFKTLVATLHEQGFQVGVWWCPVLAEPSSQVATQHAGWVMKDAAGGPILSPYHQMDFLCPALPEVVAYYVEALRRLYQDWGIDYVYHDWDDLIAMPPCFDPTHHHASPLDPFRLQPAQFTAMYAAIQQLHPGGGVQTCECGRPHDPYKMPYYNVADASDATSPHQVLVRMKVEKALNGGKAWYGPGYTLPVPPGGYDPAPLRWTVGMGGYLETYYAGAMDPAFRAEWEPLLALYQRFQLYRDEFLGLYDLAFDHPYVSVVRKADPAGDQFFYFSPGDDEAGSYAGPLEFRGLADGVRYEVRDWAHGDALIGTVTGPVGRLDVAFTTDMLYRAAPIAASADADADVPDLSGPPVENGSTSCRASAAPQFAPIVLLVLLMIATRRPRGG